MGMVLTESLPDKTVKVITSVPYQLAKRGLDEVVSKSSCFFDRLMHRSGVCKLGEYHSHPFRSFEKVDKLEPSEQDLSEMKVGNIEFIAQVTRVRSKRFWWHSRNGAISVAWGKYRIFLKAFVRDKEKKGEIFSFHAVPIVLSGS
jgi:hypothetical protein